MKINRRQVIMSAAASMVPMTIVGKSVASERDWLQEKLEQLRRWCRNVLIEPEKDGRYWIKFWTNRNQYVIHVRNFGYIGCIVTKRLPRNGEDWTRGNDLADGRYEPQTWERIMVDIVSYELV
jgi:hypothetical protein